MLGFPFHRFAVLGLVWSGITISRPALAQVLPLDTSFARWGRDRAIPVPPVDQPYSDSAYRFLAPLIGSARVIAVGEMIHGGHEPLQFRNHAIKFAVRQLGATAVAIESGFTEANVVDRFIRGGPGEIDSVLTAGISYGFDKLPENRELVLWLREHNASARRPVRFYGVDQTGVSGVYEGRAAAEATLAFLDRIDPRVAALHRADLAPVLDRFSVDRYANLSPTEQRRLKQGLVAIERAVARAAERARGSTTADEHQIAHRNAWAALRVLDACTMGGREGARNLSVIRLRDSVMAENTLWALQRAQPGERIVVFAHNGHVMNVPMTFPAIGPATRMMGQRLRSALGERMVIIGTSSDAFDSLGVVPSDMSTFEAALARLSKPNYALDLRTSDREPRVRPLLTTPWLTRLHAWLQPVVPRENADVMVVFDRVARTHFRQ